MKPWSIYLPASSQILQVTHTQMEHQKETLPLVLEAERGRVRERVDRKEKEIESLVVFLQCFVRE